MSCSRRRVMDFTPHVPLCGALHDIGERYHQMKVSGDWESDFYERLVGGPGRQLRPLAGNVEAFQPTSVWGSLASANNKLEFAERPSDSLLFAISGISCTADAPVPITATSSR